MTFSCFANSRSCLLSKEFGLCLFDHQFHIAVPIQTVCANAGVLRTHVQGAHFYGGGTSMYAALSNVLLSLSGRDQSVESWVVCLTDGVSDTQSADHFRAQLVASPMNLHMVTVGINLNPSYEQHLRQISRKFDTIAAADINGFFVHADGTTAGMDRAFDVVKSKIPVSQTFDRDGALSDEDCRGYMTRYLPSFVEPDDMLSRSFWIRFLYRRTKVFDRNESFNYNDSHDSLGSSLMEVMLSEVERLLGENQRRDWLCTNHAQLIYDFTNPDAPEFRLVCTAPDDLDLELRRNLSGLDLPGFHIPTKAELDHRDILDRFLSQALEVPLQTREDGSEALQCIDEHGFILTLDFTMKLLSIHERVACRVPCIIEGETGVSKTALTKMYSILLNSSSFAKARAKTVEDLCEIERQMESKGFVLGSASTAAERLRLSIDPETGADQLIFDLIHGKALGRSPFYADFPCDRNLRESMVQAAQCALEFFTSSAPRKTFFEINVDSSLTERDFLDMFDEIRSAAAMLSGVDASVVVFLDGTYELRCGIISVFQFLTNPFLFTEINTSSVLGLLKEIVIDHSLAGDILAENIVIIAACNPPRAQIQTTTRERDLGRSWASGHYQVAPLPASMNKVKWAFGSLTHSQEKEFIYRRIEALHGTTMLPLLRASLTEVVSEAHEIMRKFAERNILADMRRCHTEVRGVGELEAEAHVRARSIVSLRDIQRVFALFSYFFDEAAEDATKKGWCDALRPRRAMLLSVATVYYLRLDGSSRAEFLGMIEALPTEANQSPGMLEVLNHGMDKVIEATEIPIGIAVTRGLKENVFVTFVCTMSQTPLIIVGVPGSAKTLAVHIVGDNANGSDSLSPFYCTRPRLSLFHYQCSKQSTSKEISAVFEQAAQRQERVDSAKHRCVVFMDEAGLPEEEKESLKVLHYLLESHMSTKAKVGFVAISNHVLDAAKSNRCVMLLRQEPDEDEMLSIATGVLFDLREDGRACAHDVLIDSTLIPARDFAARLCSSYSTLFQESSPLSQLNTFFGLRDYIYFLKAVRAGSKTESTRLIASMKTIIYAIERNFNGVTAEELRQLTACFLKPLAASMPSSAMSNWSPEAYFRDPMIVLRDSLSPASSHEGHLNRPRFKLIIDCTDDDSILRLMASGEVVDMSRGSLFKLSNCPDDIDLERLRLVSGVKFTALQGKFAVLSQTEPVNESFYDLFNQRFREITGRDGSLSLYANIAVGGISRRSLVQPEFDCVVHVRESSLHQIPAPFLNRFEKYRLTLTDVLLSSWSKFGALAGIVARAKNRTAAIAAIFHSGTASLGWMDSRQTLESIFVDMLPHLDKRLWTSKHDVSITSFLGTSNLLSEALAEFLEHFTSVQDISAHVGNCISAATNVMAVGVAEHLKVLARVEAGDDELQKCIRLILLNRSDENQITALFATLAQMVLTRSAAFRLIQLATPESIFSNRYVVHVSFLRLVRLAHIRVHRPTPATTSHQSYCKNTLSKNTFPSSAYWPSIRRSAQEFQI